MTVILGINAFHADSAAAIVKDGKVLCAAEEERFNRIKHSAGFPVQAITWCLNDANLSLGDIDHICINTDPKAHRLRRLQYVISQQVDFRFVWNRWKNKRKRNNLERQLLIAFPNQVINAQIHYVEHHRSHLASAFYASPFEEANILSIDGFGDFASAAWGFGNSSTMRVDGQIFFPHSLGAFYTAITQFLGFPNYGDEYKVMGLAPYGHPKYIDAMSQIVNLKDTGEFFLNLQYFQHFGKKHLDHQWSEGSPIVGQHWSSNLEVLLGPTRKKDDLLEQRHMDIARSAQVIYEEALFNLLNALYRKNPCPYLCIAGGCGANSVANGKITLRTPFKKLYVQAAAGDAGGALGSALDVWHKIGNARSKPMLNAYLGTHSDRTSILDLIRSNTVQLQLRNSSCNYHISDDERLCHEISDALIQGLVVGWYDGRMEWGPRALGHRSILGDPRRPDMKDILNLKIKRRESFRPFAPSVLREEVSEWFEQDGDVPFMMQVYTIREEKRPFIPAVTHVDGTGRLQTVTKEQNHRYYDLIKLFYAKTGVPMILNTSFNENEPIVCSPSQALDCFLRTRMDILVLENVIIKREQ